MTDTQTQPQVDPITDPKGYLIHGSVTDEQALEIAAIEEGGELVILNPHYHWVVDPHRRWRKVPSQWGGWDLHKVGPQAKRNGSFVATLVTYTWRDDL